MVWDLGGGGVVMCGPASAVRGVERRFGGGGGFRGGSRWSCAEMCAGVGPVSKM